MNRTELRNALRAFVERQPNQDAAAKRLGVHRVTLNRWLNDAQAFPPFVARWLPLVLKQLD